MVEIISALTFVGVIICVLFAKPIKIKKITVEWYYLVALLGAVLVLLLGSVDVKKVLHAFTENTPVNPIKILILFISMVLLSVFLDEVGFFKHMATITLKKAKTSQKKLFLYLYIIVSVLTMFTSNDVIVLSFTPFICYFCKNAKINPVPYLAGEFIAANTFSMAFIIGNPTNIYLSTAFGVTFVDYFLVMIAPTILAGGTAFLILFLLFRKQLSKEITPMELTYVIEDKFLYWVSLSHLMVTTLFLAIGSYVKIEMYLVSIIAVASLTVTSLITAIVRREKPRHLINAIKGAPWGLVPFVLSMFVLVTALNETGITKKIYELMGGGNEIINYGVSSFLVSNFINNIPMSVLFSKIIENGAGLGAFYASVIGSNLGAYLTPIGALAGIMWHSLIKSQNVKYSYLNFIKTGLIVSIPTLVVTLISLSLFV